MRYHIKCTVRLNIFEVRIYNILTAREDLIISSRDASKVTPACISSNKNCKQKSKKYNDLVKCFETWFRCKIHRFIFRS